MKKIILISIAVISYLLLSSYVSGLVFFALNKKNPLNYLDQINPWLIYEYLGAYKENLKIFTSIKKSLAISFFGLFILFVLIGMVIVASISEKRKLYGDAKFATSNDILKGGYYTPIEKENGIVVGRYEGKLLNFIGQQFVMLSAPTRSGKGVGIVIPNCLLWQGSLVILDIKKETFNLTSGYRERVLKQKVYIFNPFDENGESCRYNPLDYIRRDNVNTIPDLQGVASILYPIVGSDPFWPTQAQNTFIALGLYMHETFVQGDPRFTLGEMLRLSEGYGHAPFHQYFEEVINDRNTQLINGATVNRTTPNEEGLMPLSDDCLRAISAVKNLAENTRTSVLASFKTGLSLWQSPVVDCATSASDFRLDDVRKQKMTIYVALSPDKLAECAPLVNLFFSQLINQNVRELPENNPELKYQCLLLMDEFTSIGQCKIIAKSLSFFAGYNLRLLTIVQSHSQLNADPPQGYGRETARTITTNHACQILYAPSQQEDAESYSKQLGDTTIKGRSDSRSKSGSSHSLSDQKRALLLPQEFKELGPKNEVVVFEGLKPIKCQKLVFYADKIFVDKFREVSPYLKKLKKNSFSKNELGAATNNGDLVAQNYPRMNVKGFLLSLGKISGVDADMNEIDSYDSYSSKNAMVNQLSGQGFDKSVATSAAEIISNIGSTAVKNDALLTNIVNKAFDELFTMSLVNDPDVIHSDFQLIQLIVED